MVIASLTRSEKNSIEWRPRNGTLWQWPGNCRAADGRTRPLDITSQSSMSGPSKSSRCLYSLETFEGWRGILWLPDRQNFEPSAKYPTLWAPACHPAYKPSPGYQEVLRSAWDAATFRACTWACAFVGARPRRMIFRSVLRARPNRPPRFRMRSLWTGFVPAPRGLWPRLLFVDTCPPVATYKANTGQTRPFRKMRTRFLDEF
jgi:hypothetical protein